MVSASDGVVVSAWQHLVGWIVDLMNDDNYHGHMRAVKRL